MKGKTLGREASNPPGIVRKMLGGKLRGAYDREDFCVFLIYQAAFLNST